MEKDISVVLDDRLSDFVDGQVTTGRHGTPGDVVRAGLRLLQEHEARVAALQDALIAGEASGEPTHFDGEAFLVEVKARHGG